MNILKSIEILSCADQDDLQDVAIEAIDFVLQKADSTDVSFEVAEMCIELRSYYKNLITTPAILTSKLDRIVYLLKSVNNKLNNLISL